MFHAENQGANDVEVDVNDGGQTHEQGWQAVGAEERLLEDVTARGAKWR